MSETDAAVAESISTHARAEAVAGGARLAAIAELATRRLGSELARDRERWACDAWDSVGAEVAAELTTGHRAASSMLHQGLDLRDRLPRIGALLANGDIPLRVATTATYRTGLIDDDELVARVDADLAEKATRFGKMSDRKLIDEVDACIERHDPDAARRFRTVERGMDVRFGKRDDDTGTRSVYGRVKITDAEVADRRMEQMAKSVCPNDPRTHGERRTEAFGIVNAGGSHLPCLCGQADCPAPGGPDARATHFGILVLTNDPGDPDGPGEPDGPHDDTGGDGPSGPYGPEDPEDREDVPTEDVVPEATPSPPARCSYTSLIAGGGAVPAPLLAELRRMGVAVRPVATSEELAADAGYRPTTSQQRFVRARDMTCCFPGCDHPAEHCDIDHTIPYETSRLTHPSNLEALCRKHHLLKTFWVGRGGWTDEQLADGTVVWTTPSGRRRTVPPGSRIHYPGWETTTPAPRAPVPPGPPAPDRGLTMPLRTRTRAQQRLANIRAERERNRQLGADEPPPF